MAFRGERDLLVAGCELAVAAVIALAAAVEVAAAAVEVAALAVAAVEAAAELAVALLGARFVSRYVVHSAVRSAVRSSVHYVAAEPHFAECFAVLHHVERDCGYFRFVRLILARDSGARAAVRPAHLQ